MPESTRDMIMDKIFECGVKRRRSLFIMVLLLMLLLSVYLLNRYLYSYRENYTLRPNEVFAEPVEVRGVPGVKIPAEIYLQMSELADIYIFDEETYERYYNKADFPENYYEDTVAFQRNAKKIETGDMSITPGTLYVVVKMPPEDKMSAPSATASLFVEYKPLEPFLYALAFLDAILLPLLALRVFILGKRAKVLRMQLSLDLDSLSDEDRVRLGLPPRGRPTAPAIAPATPPPPSEPLPPHPEVMARSTAEAGAGGVEEVSPETIEPPVEKGEEEAPGRRRKGYITPEEL